MDPKREIEAGGSVVETAGTAGLVAGVTGLSSLVLVIGGEAMVGTDFVGTGAATVAAWLTFASAALLVLALSGLLLTVSGLAGAAGSRAVWTMQLGAAVMVGAAATLPLVVVGIVDRVPAIVDSPPAAVPATFIISGVVLGVAGLRTALLTRRTAVVPRWVTNLLVVGSVVTIVPLPSRHFLLAFAVAALLRVLGRARAERAEVGALSH